MMTIAAPARRNIVTTGDTDGADMQRTFLRTRDIARLWGEERARAKYRAECRADGRAPTPDGEAAAVAAARPVADRTVYGYLQHGRRGRYRDNPPPSPVYLTGGGLADAPKSTAGAQIPVWMPADGETLDDLERRVRAWWHTRPGPGAGGGRRPKNPDETSGRKHRA